jgi:amino acid adenylation domain-containing protein
MAASGPSSVGGRAAVPSGWTLTSTAPVVTGSVLSPQLRHLAALMVPMEGGDAVRLVAHIAGPVDPARLLLATRLVFRRHAALRLRLLPEPGGQAQLAISHDLRPTGPVDGDPGGLLARLTSAGDGGHWLTLRPATGSVDAVGLVRALTAIVSGYAEPEDHAQGTTDPLEVAAYFHNLLEQEATSAGVRYWRFAAPDRYGAPELCGALRVRPSRSWDRASAAVTVAPATAARLRDVAGSLDVSLQGLLLAAWRVLLVRLAPTENGFLGMYQPGPADELPEVIGLLGRYVPVRLHHPQEAPVASVAASAQASLDESHRWADFFSWADGGPLSGFCAGFRYVELPTALRLGGAPVEVSVLQAPIEQLAIELQAQRSGDRLQLAICFDPAAVDGGLAMRMATWLASLLRQLPARLGLTATAAATIALGADSGAPPVRGAGRSPSAPDLLTLIERQTTRTPGAVAVRDERSELSYGQLIDAVRRVSSELADAEVRRGDAVAVCMRRRPPLLAALLGVLHRGAYFVPLDPTHPPARLLGLAGDASARVAITDAATSALFSGSEVATLCIDPPATAGARVPPQRGAVHGGDLAYLMYTSGSTGRPKGVRISNAALVNYLEWASDAYRVADGRGSLVHSSVAVDLTVTSLFAPLLTGQTVTLLASDDPEDLATAVEGARQLSFLKVTPSGLAMLSRLLPASTIARAARHVVVGGERLTARPLQALAAEATMVTNEYGPTETTVGSCAFTFRAGDPVPDPVPIGRPIWNTDVQIVDPSGAPCPLGIAGEIVISGAGVAKGYHNRPEDTAARFGPRGYRTGDLGRRRPDGLLEFLGRDDGQAKVHGYRVEAAEVEAVLARAPEVSDVAVVPARQDPSGATFLSAFVVLTAGVPRSFLDELASVAAAQLPPYALPDRYEALERLPLTHGGKIDRDQLTEWSRRPLAAPRPPAAAKDDRLAILSQIWARTLGRPQPTEDDNFFASGGDSIQALHLVAEARRAGLRLSLRDVLVHRTLGRITETVTVAAPPAAPPAERHAGPIPLTPNQHGFLALYEAQPHGWGLGWTFDAPGPVDAGRLTAALRSLHERHPALRCRFRPGPAGWAARVTDDPGATPRVVDMTAVPEPRRDAAVRQTLGDLAARLHLSDGPTAFLCVFDHGRDRPAQLGWVAHHLVCDVVSLQIMTRELWPACDGEDVGPAVGPAPDDTYLAFVERAAQLPPINFPQPRPGGPGRADELQMALADDVVRGLQALAAQRRGPLAALVASLLRSTSAVGLGPPELCIEDHGRDRVDLGMELPEAVGWLTSFLPIRVQPSELAAGRTLAERIRGLATGMTDLDDDGALPPVSVNFLGEVAGPAELRPSAPRGRPGPLGGPPLFPLELVCWIARETLQVRWRYDPAAVPVPTVQRLAATFAAGLPSLLAELAGTVPAHQPPAELTGDVPANDLARILDAFGAS